MVSGQVAASWVNQWPISKQRNQQRRIEANFGAHAKSGHAAYALVTATVRVSGDTFFVLKVRVWVLALMASEHLDQVLGFLVLVELSIDRARRVLRGQRALRTNC